MAAGPIQPEEFAKALELYCVGTGTTASEGEDHGQKRYLLSPGDIVVRLEEGRIITDSQSTYEKLCEILMDLRQVEAASAPKTATSRQPKAISPSGQRKSGNGAMAKPLNNLTTQDIINYINPKATEQEAYLFAEFCRRKGADPMTKQVYLVIYEGQNGRQANFIAGKEYFTEKAEAHPQFDGLEAGIIVRTKAGLEYRQGTFWMHEEEKLLGGWAIVHRKDRKIPLKMEVPLADYDTKKNLWAKMPATMIRKVALVQALREAFPQNLGGMYDQAEIVDAEIMEAEA